MHKVCNTQGLVPSHSLFSTLSFFYIVFDCQWSDSSRSYFWQCSIGQIFLSPPPTIKSHHLRDVLPSQSAQGLIMLSNAEIAGTFPCHVWHHSTAVTRNLINKMIIHYSHELRKFKIISASEKDNRKRVAQICCL